MTAAAERQLLVLGYATQQQLQVRFINKKENKKVMKARHINEEEIIFVPCIFTQQ